MSYGVRSPASVAAIGHLVEIDDRHHEPLRRRREVSWEAELGEVVTGAGLVVGFGEARPVEARVQHDSGREGVYVVHHGAPVNAVQQVAGGDVVVQVVAVFHAVVVPEVVEELVAVADVVVEAAEFAVEYVAADGVGQIVLVAVPLASLIGQRNEAEQVLGDRAQAGWWGSRCSRRACAIRGCRSARR